MGGRGGGLDSLNDSYVTDPRTSESYLEHCQRAPRKHLQEVDFIQQVSMTKSMEDLSDVINTFIWLSQKIINWNEKFHVNLKICVRKPSCKSETN